MISVISIRKKNQNPNDRDQIDQILLSLADCDALVSIIIYPLYPWLNFWNYGEYNSFPMRLFGVLVLSMTSTSSLTIIMLAAIKYLKISRSNNFENIVTENRFHLMVIMCWLLPLLMFTPSLINEELVWIINILSFAAILSTLVSLPVFCYLIVHVFKKSRRQVEEMADSTIQQASNNQVTERISKKLVRRALWLITVYFACTSLTFFSVTFYAFGAANQGYLYQFTNIFYLGNSCANPCIYMYKDKRLREIAMNIFKRSPGD